MSAKEHYEAGELSEAIQAALADVKKNPTDLDFRNFLCVLLCFSGDLERADKQLDVMFTQSPEAGMLIALFRQLLRAEQARRDFFASGRVPEFVDEPTDYQKLQLESTILIRENDAAGARELLDKAEEMRPEIGGTCDGKSFEGIRDLDDVVGGSFEVLTTNGKYYWIPMERVDSVEFRPPEFPRDLLWRAARMVVRGGPDGEVYLPAIYVDSTESADEKIQLGRATDWVGEESEPVRGIGQRMFLIGEEDRPILSVTSLEFGETGSTDG